MFGFSRFEITPALMGLVLVLWAMLTIWRAVSLPRHGAKEPVCERCKYAISGIAGHMCPECGGDLRQVGIATPRMEVLRRGTLVGTILAWTFLCVSLGQVVVVYAVIAVRSGVPSRFSTPPFIQQIQPNSNVYRYVNLTYDTDWHSITGEMKVELRLLDGSSAELRVDPESLTVRGMGADEIAWNSEVIDRWFAQCGLDTTDPKLADTAAELGRIIDVILMSPGSYVTAKHHRVGNPLGHAAFGMAGSRSPPLSVQVVRVLVWTTGAVVYTLGLVFIVRRRRRLLRSAVTCPASPPLAST